MNYYRIVAIISILCTSFRVKYDCLRCPHGSRTIILYVGPEGSRAPIYFGGVSELAVRNVWQIRSEIKNNNELTNRNHTHNIIMPIPRVDHPLVRPHNIIISFNYIRRTRYYIIYIYVLVYLYYGIHGSRLTLSHCVHTLPYTYIHGRLVIVENQYWHT